MSTSNLLQLSGSIGTVLIGLGAAYYSRRADHQTKATGNGFAAHVMHTLDSVVQRLDRIEERLFGNGAVDNVASPELGFGGGIHED